MAKVTTAYKLAVIIQCIAVAEQQLIERSMLAVEDQSREGMIVQGIIAQVDLDTLLRLKEVVDSISSSLLSFDV